jgi:hypothetical protein
MMHDFATRCASEAERFQQLSMSAVWEVAFLAHASDDAKSQIPSCAQCEFAVVLEK